VHLVSLQYVYITLPPLVRKLDCDSVTRPVERRGFEVFIQISYILWQICMMLSGKVVLDYLEMLLWELYIHWSIAHYCPSVRNIPLQVNADDGSMEVDIPQGEQPKTNEQTAGVMR
jgi:hypothetical protein